ncbi:MAG: hypothetical protein GXO26_05910 [Crenarchaeota archaeon]|nr:hypothetical protein [Thermoproteota archaeon]
MRRRVFIVFIISVIVVIISIYVSAMRYEANEVIRLEVAKGYTDGIVVYVPSKLELCLKAPPGVAVNVAIVTHSAAIHNITYNQCIEVSYHGVAIVVVRVAKIPNLLKGGVNQWAWISIKIR